MAQPEHSSIVHRKSLRVTGVPEWQLLYTNAFYHPVNHRQKTQPSSLKEGQLLLIYDYLSATCRKDTTATKESNPINDRCERNRDLTTIVGRFTGDRYIVRMAFTHSGVGNSNKLRGLKLVDGR